jgi:hypothetical protein
MQREKKRYR